MRSRVLYYFISTRDFQIGAPAVAGIGAPSVPSRRTRLSLMPVPFGYINYEKTEIDSESCEVTVYTPARPPALARITEGRVKCVAYVGAQPPRGGREERLCTWVAMHI